MNRFVFKLIFVVEIYWFVVHIVFFQVVVVQVLNIINRLLL